MYDSVSPVFGTESRELIISLMFHILKYIYNVANRKEENNYIRYTGIVQ